MTTRICQHCNGNGNVLVTTKDGSWLVICSRCDGSGKEQIEVGTGHGQAGRGRARLGRARLGRARLGRAGRG